MQCTSAAFMSNVFRLPTWSSRDRTTDLRQRVFSLTQQKASTIISSIEGNRVPAFETKNSVSAEASGTICQKTHCSGGDRWSLWSGMTQREEYLLRAAELSARAQAEGDSARKVAPICVSLNKRSEIASRISSTRLRQRKIAIRHSCYPTRAYHNSHSSRLPQNPPATAHIDFRKI